MAGGLVAAGTGVGVASTWGRVSGARVVARGVAVGSAAMAMGAAVGAGPAAAVGAAAAAVGAGAAAVAAGASSSPPPQATVTAGIISNMPIISNQYSELRLIELVIFTILLVKSEYLVPGIVGAGYCSVNNIAKAFRILVAIVGYTPYESI